MKKINKKLELNKKTIARLNDNNMNNIMGGEDGMKTKWFTICKSCIETHCNCLTEKLIASVCTPCLK